MRNGRTFNVPVRQVLALLVAALAVFTAVTGCASVRRFVAPVPPMSPEAVSGMTAWVDSTTSLADLHFTADASIATPAGEIFGGMAAESFAKGTLEGARYAGITLSPDKVFACTGRVVIVEGQYSATATDSGATQPVKGPFLLRATVDVAGTPHANLLRLSTTRGVKAGSLAHGCGEPATFRFASRPRGIVIFPAGLAQTQMQSNTVNALESFGWSCPSVRLCGGGQDPASAGFLAVAYTRLRPGYGLQLVGGRMWKLAARGFRIADHPLRSGAVALHSSVDMAALTGYIERRYFRFALGPGLVRSSWYFDATIPRADSLGFNAATATAVKPALVGTGAFILPMGSRLEFELTAVGDVAARFDPPSLLEFQPSGITANGIVIAAGLGIRP